MKLTNKLTGAGKLAGKFFWDRQIGDWVPAAAYRAGPAPTPTTMVMGDIEPYQSVVTGETIGGRRQHRDHLRAHRMIEVGNEYNRMLDQGRVPEQERNHAMSEKARAEAIREAIAEVRSGRVRRVDTVDPRAFHKIGDD